MASTRVVTAPAYWASALINNDYSGLDDHERTRCEEWRHRELAVDEEIIDCSDEPSFTWHFDLYGGDSQGGEVLDYTVLGRL